MFTPLNVNTSYTLLKSPMPVKDYVEAAKALDYQNLAISDVNVMYGVIDFYNYCKHYDINPLIGMTVSIQRPDQRDQEEWLIYAKNDQGYRSLMRLSSLIKSQEPIDYQAVRDFIFNNHRNWITILEANNGPHMRFLKQQREEEAAAFLDKLREIFKASDLYMGVDESYLYHQEALEDLAKKSQIPLIAQSKLAYLSKNDVFTQEVLAAIEVNQPLDNYREKAGAEGQFFLRSLASYQESYQNKGLAKAFDQVSEAFDGVHLDIQFDQALLPKYPIESGQSSKEFLKDLAYQGLSKRVGNKQSYRERLDYELSIIDQMGFNDYFLIVWDVMDYAHKKHIMTGPGRGSAAGSLVAYCLFITDVDPIRNHLLFERFLNPERQSMPDIDLDFPDDKRQDILNYVYHKYGSDHVAQISTFGTFAARKAIRDVGNAFNKSQATMSRWANTISSQNQTLEEAYQSSSQLQQYIAAEEDGQLWFQTAKKIEGLPRHVSTHAAGVILSDQDLTDFIPLQAALNHSIHQSQYTMHEIERIGLLKIDFLSLSNLTILANSVRAAEKISKSRLRPIDFPRNDQLVYRVFSQANTLGVFQFESNGIRRVLRRVKPSSMADLAAVNALYRPGPMQQINHFVNRKHGKEPITYPHPDLEGILKETYGIIVYQEQVMQVAQKIAGFSLGEADILRRTISKKDKATMDRLQAKFIRQAVAKGYSQSVAQKIYAYIEAFADYGFNKSHAYAYSYLAYEMAWLKVHYPAAFYYGNLLQHKIYETKGQQLTYEASLCQVKLQLPDVNRSYTTMQVVDDQHILLGLTDIRGLMRNFTTAIVQERLNGGQYRSLGDFIQRLPKNYLKADNLEKLALAGALDSFGYNRRTLIEEALPKLLEAVNLFGGSNNQQLSLFNQENRELYAPEIKQLNEYDDRLLLEGEQETLGQSISVELYSDYRPYYQNGQIQPINKLSDKSQVTIIGEIVKVKRIQTKKNQPMAFLTLRDEHSEVEVIAFPKAYIDFAAYIREGQQVLVQGKTQTRKQGLQVVLDQCQPLNHQLLTELERKRLNSIQTINIRVASSQVASEKKADLLALINKYHGRVKLTFTMAKEQKKYQLGERFAVQARPEVIQELRKIYGSENVLY
ncbi:DNA polymerase III subunit alpha [Aerococcus mictus]|uniref:DNA polymerase III subunit alpha n=1 Tax=Aerococcus mictus TaxID=2976810 RepID=A0ABZ2EEX4_9LACT|nr:MULTISPECIES: DNA polymerase III subunit alpha [Aerococcus]MDL5174627.1 DNA polymerase III subunit alpha [Aerococcus mictus]RAV72594.1 DNA polymerase III subunit alpha [Aerococcus urinae]RAW05329.1 DNA polymerase III subunit alpha [Aerococcus urinae]WMF95222.1 DNA polymerase III subunit alpha [Aerococcus mictus]